MRPTRSKPGSTEASDDLDSPDGRRGEPRRRQLVDAAIRCFEEKGFHGTSMAQISETAGMSVGHIYHYFPAKEALIAAIVEKKLDEIIERMAEAARGSSLLEALAARDGDCAAIDERRRERALFLDILAEAERNPKVSELMSRARARLFERQREIFRALEPAAAHLPDSVLNARLEVFNALLTGLRLIPGIDQMNCDALCGVVEPTMRSLLQFDAEAQAKP
jgi:TetR/AcrR family transcriptional regulator, repressor for uid operon